MNRWYFKSDSRKSPAGVRAVENLLKSFGTDVFIPFNPSINNGQLKQQRIMAVVDIHAHATKRGVFIFGNAPYESLLASGTCSKEEKRMYYLTHVAINLLPSSMHHVQKSQVLGPGQSQESFLPWFSLSASEVSEKSMGKRDRRGETSDGSLRVGAFRGSCIPLSYTLEAHYHARCVVKKKANFPPNYELKVQDYYNVGITLIHSFNEIVSIFMALPGLDNAHISRVLETADKRSRKPTTPLVFSEVSKALAGAGL